MPRLIITVPKKMHDALKRESDRTDAPIAALVRKAIEEWAQQRDIEVRDTIAWGGSRERSKDESESSGQEPAYATSAA